MWKEIYYKELPHRIMEADKSQGLQGKCQQVRDPRKLMVWFQPESKGLRNRRTSGVVPV